MMDDNTVGTRTLDYTVAWAGDDGVSTVAGGTTLTGASGSSFDMPEANNLDCSTNGDNASLIVEISEDDLADVQVADTISTR